MQNVARDMSCAPAGFIDPDAVRRTENRLEERYYRIQARRGAGILHSCCRINMEACPLLLLVVVSNLKSPLDDLVQSDSPLVSGLGLA